MAPIELVPNDASTDYKEQQRKVLGLRASAYQAPPDRRSVLLPVLVLEESKLLELQDGLPTRAMANESAAAPNANLLGPETTQLEVLVDVCMSPIPTAIYPLLTSDTHPLLRVTVKNLSHKRRRVRVRAGIDALSSESVKTVELAHGNGSCVIPLLPTLLPGKLSMLDEVQRVTVYVITEDLDNKIESHDTWSVVCLSRNTSFNAITDASTGMPVDFSRYYGAWVTPYDESVQECIRDAAALCDPPQIWGYQGEPEDVDRQVAAMFQALQRRGITYVNSVIDYGAPEGYYTQRTRLPRESLARKSANCIDGTVLMASLLEGASLNPGIVLVPGHAFVAWETWRKSGEWRFLETTMIGGGTFESACRAAQETYDHYQKKVSPAVRLLALKDLRQQGIWPMA